MDTLKLVGWMSEREKVDIYRGVINEFNINGVFIKPHPLENTNYAEYFDVKL